MSDTPISLLDRLRSRPDAATWRRLVELYTPVIRGWLRQNGLHAQDADDLSQDILTVVVRELPRFQHNNQRGAFRHWLRLVTVHRLRDFWRARRARPLTIGAGDFEARLDQLEDPHSDLSRRWDEEHNRAVAQRFLELVEPEFQPRTWQAFRRVVLDEVAPADAARELGLSVNAVLIAKSRVLHRLREEMRGLTD